MHCPMCGFARPGEAASCSSCGHEFSALSPDAVPRKLRPNVARAIVYSLFLFGVARGFMVLESRYLDAEQSRVESVLLKQAVDHRKEVQDALAEE